MDIQIVSTQMIKPTVPTPHLLRNFNLSFLDQLIPPFFVPLTLFYNTKFDVSNISEIHNHLKKSLSETLTIFYPLAGRIQNPVFVDCNDEGVSYTEATATCTLSEFLKGPHVNSLNKFLPLDANVLKGGGKCHVSLQVTVLECGGLVIGVCMFHRISDCATTASFLKTWADLFRGKGDKKIEIHQDLAVGSSLFPPLSSLPDDYELNNANFFFNEGNRSITRRFVFNASSIATLRAKAASQSVPNPSRIEALTGFITERLMAGLASIISNKPPPPVMISHIVNIRRRLDPPLPHTAFGNLIWFIVAFYAPSESKMELSEYVETLREVMLQRLNSKKLREQLNQEDVVRAMRELHGVIKRTSDDEVVPKVLKFTSWCNMGLNDVHFGWGKPAWVAHMADAASVARAKHQFLFLDGRIGSGEIELWALLDEHDMAILENDHVFTAIASPNPRVRLEV